MKADIKFVADLLRVKQWVKNTFIFFPILFSGLINQPNLLISTLIAFAGFCIVSSGLYVFNDYRDREQDRLHPKKANRPLVRSNLSPVLINSLIYTMTFAGLFICWLAGLPVLFTALVYVAIHLIYNFFVKRVVILDVVFIALGFQVRIWAGGVAAGVFPSVWLQLCVFLLALFLGYNKRRFELETLGDTATEHRHVLTHYTPYLLDQIIMICATLAIVFYGLYTISYDIVNRINSPNMVYSVVFVIYGMFRYLYLVHVKKQGDDPGEILATDSALLINVLLWIGYTAVLLYKPM